MTNKLQPHDSTAPVSVSIVTMGCAKNEVDSLHMGEALGSAGYALIDDAAKADCIIVNTCSFIQSATEESLQAIFEAFDLPQVKEGEGKVVVAGCMPARYGDDLTAALDEAQTFVPCSKEDDIVAVLDALFPHRGLAASAPETAPLYSAYVKISDGCDRFCSYCTIPYIRGRYHSFTLDEIERELKACLDRGAREIVLIAQDTGRWGTDFDTPSSLAALMATLAEAHPDTWFRVMYLQPEGVTDELLRTMASHDNICSYLDIPFQHVNERILAAMNRKGSRAAYETLIGHVRALVPGITLRTTFIAGFPTETEDEFQEVCDFIEDADLDYIGVFPYSQEEGTVAGRMDGQVDEDTKEERARELRAIADSISRVRVADRIGTRQDVLVLGREEDGQLYGRAMCQAPDVDGVTFVHEGAPGDIVTVTITDTLLYEMEGE